MDKDKILLLVLMITIALTIALTSSIIEKNGCKDAKGDYGEIIWGLAIGTVSAWALTILLIISKTGLGFRFETLFKRAGEFMLLSFFGSLLLPSILIAEADDKHNGKIDSGTNNIAVIGLALSIWMVLSVLIEVMFDKNLYMKLKSKLSIF